MRASCNRDADEGTKEKHDHNGGHGDDGRRRPFTKTRRRIRCAPPNTLVALKIPGSGGELHSPTILHLSLPLFLKTLRTSFLSSADIYSSLFLSLCRVRKRIIRAAMRNRKEPVGRKRRRGESGRVLRKFVPRLFGMAKFGTLLRIGSWQRHRFLVHDEVGRSLRCIIVTDGV